MRCDAPSHSNRVQWNDDAHPIWSSMIQIRIFEKPFGRTQYCMWRECVCARTCQKWIEIYSFMLCVENMNLSRGRGAFESRRTCDSLFFFLFCFVLEKKMHFILLWVSNRVCIASSIALRKEWGCMRCHWHRIHLNARRGTIRCSGILHNPRAQTYYYYYVISARHASRPHPFWTVQLHETRYACAAMHDHTTAYNKM